MRLARHGLVALGFGTTLLGVSFAARVLQSGTTTYGFLGWNLALAWVPWICATFVERDLARGATWRSLVGGLGWLAFLPNAPYLFTDFVHLRHRAPVPLWFDVLFLGTAALTGLLAGAFSLRRVQGAVAARFGRAAGWSLVALALPAAGLGIYLGRVERLNSWDLLLHPRSVLSALAHAASPRAAAMSLAAGGLCAIAYLAVLPSRAEPAADRTR